MKCESESQKSHKAKSSCVGGGRDDDRNSPLSRLSVGAVVRGHFLLTCLGRRPGSDARNTERTHDQLIKVSHEHCRIQQEWSTRVSSDD